MIPACVCTRFPLKLLLQYLECEQVVTEDEAIPILKHFPNPSTKTEEDTNMRK